MMLSHITGLFWFRHDLRLHDNQALIRLADSVDRLVCVFVVDPRWFRSGHYQSAHLGIHRRQFLLQSLIELDHQLQSHGQRLQVVQGYPVEVISDLIHRHRITSVAVNAHPGVYERQQIQRLHQQLPTLQQIIGQGHTLFEHGQLPFGLQQLPESFTPFRKWVEDIPPPAPEAAPKGLPPLADRGHMWQTGLLGVQHTTTTHFAGGEDAGLRQLSDYLADETRVKTYKQTRNGLDGWNYSTKLSAWLANGNVSVRQVYAAIRHFEATFGANDSTYWLIFELLWREYFQWYLWRHGHKLFSFSGVRQRRPLTTFNGQRFARWCQGETGYAIVDACMKQLNTSGFISNRGRQLVASCLVHELALDWRFGAAYFEQQLLDFDVASNWGNWQYLAGVGADPRGHRRFDLEKQARTYDPEGEFVRRWLGDEADHVSCPPADNLDAVDWPIS